jgi:hypothetical protein
MAAGQASGIIPSGGTVASGPRVPSAVAKWSRFPSRRLLEVLKTINPGIADGVQGLRWRTPV